MSNVSQFIGSGWIPLETIEVTSTVTTVDFDSNIDDTFNNYVVTGTHTVSGTGASIYCRLKTGDPSAPINTNYRYLSTSPSATNSGTAVVYPYAVITSYSGSFRAYFMNLRSSDGFKSIVSEMTGYLGGTMYAFGSNNALLDTSIINGIQLYPSSGGITPSSKFTLYGIQEL